MAHIPDPGEDFDGCIKALYDQVAEEIAGMTEEEQEEHFLTRSIDHLVRMYELDAPRFLIKMAHDGLNKKLKALRARMRSTRKARK
jgi:FKBP-type peptidyl-prolyl cis-trans isomerase (trigger factor)